MKTGERRITVIAWLSILAGVCFALTPGSALGQSAWNSQTSFSSIQGGNQWSYLGSSTAGGANGTNMTYGTPQSATWWGYDWATNDWLYVSDTQQHPGNALDSIRRWTAPYAGTVTIVGTSRMTNAYAGDGAYIRIRKGTITGTLASQTQLYQGLVASAC